MQALAVEQLADYLRDFRATGPRFQNKMEEIERLMKATEANEFDRGLVELGKLLGFEAWKPAGTAPPDCVWQLGSWLLIVFEGKSDESVDGSISIQDCRQSSAHLDWVRAQDDLKGAREIISVLVTPRVKLDPNAIPYAEGIYFVNTSAALALFERAKSMLLEARGVMTDGGDELGEKLLEVMTRMNLTPEEIRNQLTLKPAIRLPSDI